MKDTARLGRHGFTLLELLIAIVILGVILAVSTPSISRYLESQRLRSINGELMNDLQFARAEAVSRQQIVGIRLERNSDQTCYTVAAYTGGNCLLPADARMATCDCRAGAGSACTGNWVEIKSVGVPASTGIALRCHFGAGPTDCAGPTAPQNVAFDPTSGQISYCNPNLTGALPPPFTVYTIGVTSGQLRTHVAPAGRPRSCVGSGTVAGMPSC